MWKKVSSGIWFYADWKNPDSFAHARSLNRNSPSAYCWTYVWRKIAYLVICCLRMRKRHIYTRYSNDNVHVICSHLTGDTLGFWSLPCWVQFSADDIFSTFPQKTVFEISYKVFPMKTICMKCHILLSGKNKKNISRSSVECSTYLFFRENTASRFMRIIVLTEDSYEMVK